MTALYLYCNMILSQYSTVSCHNIVHFAYDIVTVLYSENGLDPNLNKYLSNFYPLTLEFLSLYPNPYPCPLH